MKAPTQESVDNLNGIKAWKREFSSPLHPPRCHYITCISTLALLVIPAWQAYEAQHKEICVNCYAHHITSGYVGHKLNALTYHYKAGHTQQNADERQQNKYVSLEQQSNSHKPNWRKQWQHKSHSQTEAENNIPLLFKTAQNFSAPECLIPAQ